MFSNDLMLLRFREAWTKRRGVDKVHVSFLALSGTKGSLIDEFGAD
jgi:hypothetical protein